MSDFPEHTYKLTFAFNGTEFFGWQRQTSGERTVQQVMEDILRNIFHDVNLSLTGCSRTDAGVHALGMAASFHTGSKMPPDQLVKCLEKRLPHDIRILNAEEMPDGFNAHTGCFGRAYVYAVNLGYHTLFQKYTCWSWLDCPYPDIAVKSFETMLPGTHDFRNFCARREGVSTTVRTIYRAEVKRFGPVLCFYLSGNGFLHKMIRRIMGLIHEIAAGDRDVSALETAVNDPEYGVIESVAPPDGLYLKKAFASEDEWKTDTLEYPPFFF